MSDYYNLGSHRRPTSTAVPDAQLWFDRGLMWLYGYNHAEAVKCFRRALEHDPRMAMAHWGVAYGVGPNYNMKWEYFSPALLDRSLKDGRAAILNAFDNIDSYTPVEAALLRALEKRFQRDDETDVEVLEGWNGEYAAAMRQVYRDYPNDLDVAALFAEALMNRTPWQLWDLDTGEPAEDADTLEAVEVIEAAMRQIETNGAKPHPALLHLYIHAVEMSPEPEKALRAADQLRELAPDAGHLLHMPSHIDLICGDYHSAVQANRRALQVDWRYAEQDGELTDYTFYRAHNIHFKLYAAMMLGQYSTAMGAADDIERLTHEDLLRVEEPTMADHLEGLRSMRLHALIRFGKWREILEFPAPGDPALYCNTVAMRHYARAIAYATLGQAEDAENEVADFDAAAALVPETRFVFNNTCVDLLAIACRMMRGEVAYHRGDHDLAFEHLRAAVELDDNLEFAEPWGWAMPTRHALGALLLEQNETEAALDVYRADLGFDETLARPMRRPNNVWSLKGMVSCLDQLGRQDEADLLRPRLRLALARTDVPIQASCFCATGCCH